MSYDTPEGKVKKEGRQICRSLGLYYFPVNQGGTSKPGIPDDTVCVGGVFTHIEYKAHMRWDKNIVTCHKTLPTDQQVRRMEECRLGGGATLVVDDLNLEYLKPVLQAMLHHTTQVGHSIPGVQHIGQRSACGWNWTYLDYEAYKRGDRELWLPQGMTIPVPIARPV